MADRTVRKTTWGRLLLAAAIVASAAAPSPAFGPIRPDAAAPPGPGLRPGRGCFVSASPAADPAPSRGEGSPAVCEGDEPIAVASLPPALVSGPARGLRPSSSVARSSPRGGRRARPLRC